MLVSEAIRILEGISSIDTEIEVTLLFGKASSKSYPYTPVPTQPTWVDVPNYVAHMTCRTLQ